VRLRALLLAAASLLSGCSALELAYDNADVWLSWRASHYLDLDDAQAREYDKRVASFLAWHRKEALPEYARLAEEAAARLARGAARDDMVWGYDAVRAQAREGMRRAGAEMGDFLDRLTPAQVDHLERRLADDNRRYARLWLAGTPQEQRRRRLERLLHGLEDWLGELSDAQRERVRSFNDVAPYNAAQRDRERRRLQAELLAMLRARASAGALADWAAHWDRHREPGFARANRELTGELLTMLADLERTLSERQRAHVVERLRDYARDFGTLAAAR
jgi:hypothetical protein